MSKCGECSRKNSKKLSKEEFMSISKFIKDKSMNYVQENIWDGVFPEEVTKNYKISICTTCMGRTHDLKVTLPKNIEDNLDYPNLEFVVLNYNSNDDLDEWIKRDMAKYIDSGILKYYKTTEPKYYSMSHSRNIAFKVASGEIVNNVDADAFTNKGFATYLNKLANQQKEKVIFAKGRRMMRGRLGFYKNEFIELLGGYDENLNGYGHDDHDIKDRAWGLGFKMYWFGGAFHDGIKTEKVQKIKNMEVKDWKKTEDANKEISFNNLKNKIFKANQNKDWGKAILSKNFKEEIHI
jgi:hypothetical protein